MSNELTAPAPQVPRDRWGRPLVIPPRGGKPVAYRRCTRYIGVLDDRAALEKWKMRQVAAGLAARPDLIAQAASAAGDKTILGKAAEAAMEAAGSSAAATTGTAVHRLTEQLDAGQEPVVPEAHRGDLDAYRQATAGWRMVDMELFVVNDDIKVGGTFDRLIEYGGQRFIADIKTGSIEYGWGEIEMQLAIYARSARYDPNTGARSPLDASTDWGLVIHLPAGQGRCDVWWANLADGWEGVRIAERVWGWRDRRHRPGRQFVALPREVAEAPSVQRLEQLWQQHEHQWTDDLTALAAARKKELLTQGG